MKMKYMIERCFFTLLLFAGLAACSSSDKNEEILPTPESLEIYGYYTGHLKVSVVGFDGMEIISKEFNDEIIQISKGAGEDDFTFHIVNFRWDDVDLGNIHIPVKYKLDDIRCDLDGRENITLNEIGKCNFDLKGSIRSKVLSFNSRIKVAETGDEVAVAFNGRVSKVLISNVVHGFEEWYIPNPFEVPVLQYKLPRPSNEAIWQSTDGELAQICWMGSADQLSVISSPIANSGSRSVELHTVDVVGDVNLSIPSVYAGILYWGTYKYNRLDPQSSLRFGIPFEGEPLRLKGYYSYTPGETYHYCYNIKHMDQTYISEAHKDAFLIKAVLYKVSDISLQKEMLTLEELFESDRIVAEASISSTKMNREFEPFDLQFVFREGQSYEGYRPYRLAFFATPSIQGRKFSGAPGSVLRLDDIELVTRLR